MYATRHTAVIDACVLCSTLKRHLILTLADAELIRVQWSDDIIDETARAMRIIWDKNDRTDSQPRADRTLQMMNEAFTDATVTGYKRLETGIGKLPDDGDRHVIAAAIKAKANTIVTENLRDFPNKALAIYGIKAQSCDHFVADIIDAHPIRAIRAIQCMQQRLYPQAQSSETLVADLKRIGLKHTAVECETNRESQTNATS